MFHKIISVVFEPFGITMALGMLWVVRQAIKREILHRDWLLLLLSVFMFVWRCAYGTAASRYWAVIILPALYYSTLFCWMAWRNAKISFFFIAVLVAFSVGKNLHFNPYSRFILNASEVVSNDAKNYSTPLIVDCNTNIATRLSYYTKLPMVSDEFTDCYLRSELAAARGLYEVVYLVYNVTKKYDLRDEKMLQDWGAELIFEQFQDRYKKKITYIYRLPIVPHPSPQPMVELYYNGGFETLSPEPKFDPPEPYRWGCSKRGYAEKLETVSPAITGERSLFLQQTTPVTLYPYGKIKLSRDRDFLFTVKNAKGTKLTVWMNLFEHGNESKKNLLNIEVNTNDVYQFQIPLEVEALPSDTMFNIYWSIISPSGMLLDDVGFGAEKVREGTSEKQVEDAQE